MSFPKIFEKEVTQGVLERLNKLSETSQPQWGKMNSGQMLAHCNVTYEMAFEDKHPKAKGFKRWVLTKFVKPTVVNDAPYKKNSRTAPAFLVSDQQVFETQKERLVNYLNKTVELGESHFDGKESNSFGKLNSNEWNNMFYKHLEHHFTQFGV